MHSPTSPFNSPLLLRDTAGVATVAADGLFHSWDLLHDKIKQSCMAGRINLLPRRIKKDFRGCEFPPPTSMPGYRDVRHHLMHDVLTKSSGIFRHSQKLVIADLRLFKRTLSGFSILFKMAEHRRFYYPLFQAHPSHQIYYIPPRNVFLDIFNL
jgi:hypothetical protein